MYSLTIVFGPSAVPWVLLFKTEEGAKKALAVFDVLVETIKLADDFGQAVSVRAEQVHGIMLEDMELSKMAHIEQGLHRARTQAKAQQLAQSDPTLRTAQMMGGPAMINPGFGGAPAFNGRG